MDLKDGNHSPNDDAFMQNLQFIFNVISKTRALHVSPLSPLRGVVKCQSRGGEDVGMTGPHQWHPLHTVPRNMYL